MPRDFGILTCSTANYRWEATAAGTIQVKTGAGLFRGIFVSKVGTGTPSYLSVYDSTGASTGTLMADFVTADSTLYSLGVDVPFTNGLYVSGGTANFTVLYT